MSAKTLRLSGAEVVRRLSREGFQVIGQRGSHLKLRRLGPDGEKQTLVVPRHDELDPGTMRAIIRQASRYFSEQQLREIFYS